MSTNEHPSTADSRTLDALPDFELTWDYDDLADPTTVTVHPRSSPDTLTQWITVDRDHAISIDRLE